MTAVPLHRALTEPVLMAGAPRAVAIANGTIATAIGLGMGLWPVGLALWALGHALAVMLTRRDPLMLAVAVRHLRLKGHLAC